MICLLKFACNTNLAPKEIGCMINKWQFSAAKLAIGGFELCYFDFKYWFWYFGWVTWSPGIMGGRNSLSFKCIYTDPSILFIRMVVLWL